MADGMEDLMEKKLSEEVQDGDKAYSQWENFQGREDAQMLKEKQFARNRFASQKDYERACEDNW